MTILIFEDETLAAEKLKQTLLEIDPSFEIVATLKSVESAIEWLLQNKAPDLIISDIKLLDGLSFEIFQQVKTDVPVIFTTAYDQYAIKAFEVNSIDYLLKPVQKEKLAGSLQKLQSQRGAKAPISYDEVWKLLRSGQPEYKSRFMIRIGQRIMAVPVEKIAYFISESKLTYIVTQDNHRYPFDLTLDEIDQQINPKSFFKINRQFIISFGSIAEIHPYFKGRIKLKLTPDQPDEIIVSSETTPEFKKWLDQ
ncbi:DNA-binding response regulator [Cytophagales bacterium WSM2-2]|nr:DNA-binding response regulator [Cytophagales bacterium WSM2-2]